MQSDTRLRPARPPRGLILSTGEEVPAGQSLRARLVVVEIRPRDVNRELLGDAQEAANQGLYAQAMAGYVCWLAPRLDEVRAKLQAISRERRDRTAISHSRTADVLAQISTAWTVWLEFVVGIGAATRGEADAIEVEVWAALTELAAEQCSLQRDHEPTERFLSLVDAVLSSGKGHVTSAEAPGERPAHAGDLNALGWRRYEDGSWHPQGTCIGWLAADGLYLEPQASFAAAQQLGGASGEGIGVAAATLHRRMYERGLLLSVEQRGNELRFKTRKTIGGRRREVIHIAHRGSDDSASACTADPPGPTGPTGPTRARH